jgi:hypothetical protein
MPDQNSDPDSGAVAPDRSDTGTPRWVKVFGVIALVVVVLFVVLLLVRGGEHGPGRHSPGGGSDAPGEHTGPPPGVTHTQP